MRVKRRDSLFNMIRSNSGRRIHSIDFGGESPRDQFKVLYIATQHQLHTTISKRLLGLSE